MPMNSNDSMLILLYLSKGWTGRWTRFCSRMPNFAGHIIFGVAERVFFGIKEEQFFKDTFLLHNTLMTDKRNKENRNKESARVLNRIFS